MHLLVCNKQTRTNAGVITVRNESVTAFSGVESFLPELLSVVASENPQKGMQKRQMRSLS